MARLESVCTFAGTEGSEPQAHSLSAKYIFTIIMFFVYIIFSKKLKKRYVGFTSDINKRLAQHNNYESKFTSSGVPWILIHFEEFEFEKDARLKEKFYKSGVGRKFIDNLYPQFTRKHILDAGVSALK
jgi:putative endonuclease